MLLAIYHNLKRLLEPDMTDELILVFNIEAVKIINIIIAFIDIWIYCKIAHPEGRQVLEEMGTLTRVDPVVFQS